MAQSAELAAIDNNPSPTRELAAPMTPMEMLSHAIATGGGVELIDKLMTLQERWEANQGRKAFDAAIAAAKAEMPVIFKSREVDFTSSKGRTHYRYEDLAEIAKTIDPILTQHGLSYRFRTAQDGPMVTVTCVLAHKDGHYEETSLSAGRDETGNKNNHQAVASAVTYLQRYTLKAALGLAASADDNGMSAGAADDELVSIEQIDELSGLIEATGTNIALFCKYYRIPALEQLPAAKFAAAKHALQSKQKAAANADH